MPDQSIGWVCCAVAAVGFGSNYLPVKRVDVQDGQLFSLCVSTGVVLVGLFQWATTGFYKFEPFAMLGGASWAAGNLMVPFIIQNAGLGAGQLVWGFGNLLVGWACGTFGLLGKERDAVDNPLLNFVGVAVAGLSVCMFALMKPEEAGMPAENEFYSHLDDDRSDNRNQEAPVSQLEQGQARKVGLAKPQPKNGFVLGLALALLAGMLFGTTFNPPTVLMQLGLADVAAGRQPRHSPHIEEYIFSHFCGVFLTTLVAFVARHQWSPLYIGGRTLVLCGLLSGIIWASAQVCWFTANVVLSFVVAFPIIVGVPGVIAALWGTLFFGENRGRRNSSLLGAAFLLQGLSVLAIAGSK